MLIRNLFPFFFVAIALATPSQGQSETAATPIVGLRDNRPRDYALQHAEVFVEPGRSIVDATVLVRGTSITAVGTDIEIPPGFMTLDLTGKKIYAGLIDAWSETSVSLSNHEAGYWNRNVMPQRSAATAVSDKIEQADKLRSQGFTARLVAPEGRHRQR